MAFLRVRTSSGTEHILTVEGLDEATKHYEPAWRTSPSPFSAPQNAHDHQPAGSVVSYGFERVNLPSTLMRQVLAQHPEFRREDTVYLREREAVDYSVTAKVDFDVDCHVGKHYPGSQPRPHWNFIVKRSIFEKSEKMFSLDPKTGAHVPKCDWVDVSLEIGEMMIFHQRFFWQK